MGGTPDTTREHAFEERPRRQGVGLRLATAVIAASIALKAAEASAFQDQASTTKLVAMESAFREIEAEVLANMNRYVRSHKMRDRIRASFAAFEAGSGSPDRFDGPNLKPVPYGAARRFYYFLSNVEGRPMSFDGLHRNLRISNDFDPRDPAYLSGLSHEMCHASADDQRRDERRIPESVYIGFWKRKDRRSPVLLEEERACMGVQLEVLNVLTHGRIKADIRAGRTPDMPIKNPKLRAVFSSWAQHYFIETASEFSGVMRDFYRSRPQTYEMFRSNFQPEER